MAGEEGAAADVVEITDERSLTADAALRLFERAFDPRDRQPVAELRSEIEEKRLDLLITTDYHMLAAVRPDGSVAGAISGVYLQGINAGFVYYLVVDEGARGMGIGRRVRSALVQRFRADAQRADQPGLAWVLGEVRRDNPWLPGLVRRRGAIPLGIRYFHPGMTIDDSRDYVLYRQPVNDDRIELPATEVARVLYQIYRRAYRVGYPLHRETFRTMIEEAKAIGMVGLHADFAMDADSA